MGTAANTMTSSLPKFKLFRTPRVQMILLKHIMFKNQTIWSKHLTPQNQQSILILKMLTDPQWLSLTLSKRQSMGAPLLNTLKITPPPSRLQGKTKEGISVQKLENNHTVFLTRAIKKARQVCLIFLLIAKSSIFQVLESPQLSEVASGIQMFISNSVIKVVLRAEARILVKMESLALIQISRDSKRPYLHTRLLPMASLTLIVSIHLSLKMLLTYDNSRKVREMIAFSVEQIQIRQIEMAKSRRKTLKSSLKISMGSNQFHSYRSSHLRRNLLQKVTNHQANPPNMILLKWTRWCSNSISVSISSNRCITSSTLRAARVIKLNRWWSVAAQYTEKVLTIKRQCQSCRLKLMLMLSAAIFTSSKWSSFLELLKKRLTFSSSKR